GNMDEFRQAAQQGKIMGILEMESATEHQQRTFLAFIVDDLMATLRVVVQMNQASEGRRGIVVERVRVTGREQHHITILNPYWFGVSFNLQIGSTKTNDVEHAVLAGRKVVAPGR